MDEETRNGEKQIRNRSDLKDIQPYTELMVHDELIEYIAKAYEVLKIQHVSKYIGTFVV